MLPLLCDFLSVSVNVTTWKLKCSCSHEQDHLAANISPCRHLNMTNFVSFFQNKRSQWQFNVKSSIRFGSVTITLAFAIPGEGSVANVQRAVLLLSLLQQIWNMFVYSCSSGRVEEFLHPKFNLHLCFLLPASRLDPTPRAIQLDCCLFLENKGQQPNGFER